MTKFNVWDKVRVREDSDYSHQREEMWISTVIENNRIPSMLPYKIKNVYWLDNIYGEEDLELANEFEAGEIVEVRDGEICDWKEREYILTIPWIREKNSPYIVKDWEDDFDYFRNIRKTTKASTKELTIEEISRELWYEVKVVKG